MTRFANHSDAGARLVAPVRDALAPTVDPLLVAVVPNGVAIAEVLADDLGLGIVGVQLQRDGEPTVVEMPDVAGRDVVVVDDGVETGTAARLVGVAAREGGAARVLLAVPVCPRQTESGLRHVYDDIVAIDRPLGRRDLRWHYADLDTIDEAEALRRLAAR